MFVGEELNLKGLSVNFFVLKDFLVYVKYWCFGIKFCGWKKF
jgi:hypothetical protein